MLRVCRESAEAEALDAGQDVVSGLGPAEGFGIGICRLDVSFDGLFEFGNRAEHPSLERAFCQQREEAFDLVDP